MKFFESKYYTPLEPVTNTQVGMTFNYSHEYHEQVIRDIITIRNQQGTGSIAKKIIEYYGVRLPYNSNYTISKKVIRDTWERVEDLNFISKVGPKDGLFESLTDTECDVYFNATAQVFVTIYGDSTDGKDYVPIFNIVVPYMVNTIDAIKHLIELDIVDRVEENTEPRIGILTTGSRGLSIKYSNVTDKPIDFETMYPEGFAKASNVILAKVQSEEATGLIILHGAAGTGKTNYIRWLSARATRGLVFIPPHMVTALTTPAFLEFLIENKGLTFVVEDAEASLSPRKGSENSIVSSILNMTDGLLGDVLRCQFICTFNTELTNIDDALLRPGRLLVRHEFEKLSIDEANKYFESVGLDNTATTPMSLAEVININDAPTVSEKSKKTSFGFNVTR